MIELRGKNKSRAALILEQLEADKKQRALNEDSLVELYPKQPGMTYQHKRILDEEMRTAAHKQLTIFQEDVMKELFFQAIYNGVCAPVLEQTFANSHHRDIMINATRDFINEHNVYELLDDWKYKNIYLAEFANIIQETYELITETAKDKLKEGLTEKDAYQIENEKIDNFIIDTKDIIPDDITKTIVNRVEDSINDFVNDNKTNRTKVMEIYDKAKDKISQAEEITQDPVEQQEIQQEALRTAKRQELAITESNTNVFGALTKILVEAAMKVPTLQSTYLQESGKVDLEHVLADARTMYTFMEALNTLDIIKADEKYVSDTLTSLKESVEKTVNN